MEPATPCHSPGHQGDSPPLIVYCNFARESTLNSPGQWPVDVHRGHIVKVAKVAAEMSAEAARVVTCLRYSSAGCSTFSTTTVQRVTRAAIAPMAANWGARLFSTGATFYTSSGCTPADVEDLTGLEKPVRSAATPAPALR